MGVACTASGLPRSSHGWGPGFCLRVPWQGSRGQRPRKLQGFSILRGQGIPFLGGGANFDIFASSKVTTDFFPFYFFFSSNFLLIPANFSLIFPSMGPSNFPRMANKSGGAGPPAPSLLMPLSLLCSLL